ncbi:MAG: 2,3-bisphosphoglycerate-independent phosphoglycerate mutase [Chloroflexi bacterium]|nr:2,3-bisphosphoglycerate-independent phosphoglycerate mutase [Chloroflexota bacterium]
MASDARSDSSTPGARPLVLIVIDGWGIASDGPSNAISLAKTPTMDRLWASCPHTSVEASGAFVGLPEGQIGNSEVGHLNIGAGYPVLQDLPRIDHDIQSGAFFENPALVGAVEYVKNGEPTDGRAPKLHLMGLFSDGGVHSHAGHALALLELAKRHGVEDVQLHLFLDGRDVPPRQALDDLKTFEPKLEKLGNARVATISGRYYAMDRDKRWDRTAQAYAALVSDTGAHAETAQQAVQQSYDANAGDEFVTPTIVGDADVGRIRSGDAVIFFNFRADRARQLTRAFVQPDFGDFERSIWPHPLHYVTFAEYESGLPVTDIAFPATLVETPLAKVVADAGLRQLHVAETEKYAHVTYFLNGGHEEAFPGEDRVLVPSPKVATYDLQPTMSAEGVADKAIEGIESGTYALIALNFANPDMVGHTGVLDAAIVAVETVDSAIGRISEAARQAGYCLVVTADHGNAEEMVDEKGRPKTAHTTNPVPVIVEGAPEVTALADGGKLSDVAPTVLELLGLSAPAGMTARSLIEHEA